MLKLMKNGLEKTAHAIKKHKIDYSFLIDQKIKSTICLTVLFTGFFIINVNAVGNSSPIDSKKQTLSVPQIVPPTYTIAVNGTSVAHLKTKSEANSVLDTIKNEYVLKIKKTGDSKILSVKFKEKVEIKQSKVKDSSLKSKIQAIEVLKKGGKKQVVHKVKSGDTISSISKKYQIKVRDIKKLNPKLNSKKYLKINQKIIVTAPKPLVSVSVVKEVSENRTVSFSTVYKEDPKQFKGDSKVLKKGIKGEKSVQYLITEINGEQVSKKQQSSKVLKQSQPQVVAKGTKVIPSRGTGDLVWPTNGGYISSSIGYRGGKYHKGMDIARPSNYTIKAVDNGKIEFSGWDGGYGNKIIINHNNGMKTIYAHLNKIDVSVGQTVQKGQTIGIMGSTGNSSGIHLHFELYIDGSLRNPQDYF